MVVLLIAAATQRDGYVHIITTSSAKRWLATLLRRPKTTTEEPFLSDIRPKYGVPQLLRNMLFWAIVLIIKVLFSTASWGCAPYASLLQGPLNLSCMALADVWCTSRAVARTFVLLSYVLHFGGPAPIELLLHVALQFSVDFFIIIGALPDPIRGLLRRRWLRTCDGDIGDTNIPCAENMVLVAALCFPIFLVTLFDTGIFYQVAVFIYGCLNGLFVQKLGQVVTWSDLITSFDRGVRQFRERMLSKGAQDRWQSQTTPRQFFEWEANERRVLTSLQVSGNLSESLAAPQVHATDNAWSSEGYRTWTPFSFVWDVRLCIDAA